MTNPIGVASVQVKSWKFWLGAITIGILGFFVTMPAYILDPTNIEWIFHQPSWFVWLENNLGRML